MLIQRRKTVGYTQEKLAEELGVDRTTVVRWERAESQPQPWQRPKLAELLRISAEELHDILLEVSDLPSRGAGTDTTSKPEGALQVAPDNPGMTDQEATAHRQPVAHPPAPTASVRLERAIADAYDLVGLRQILEGCRLNVAVADIWALAHPKEQLVHLLVDRAATQGWLPTLVENLRQDTACQTLRIAADAFLTEDKGIPPIILVPPLEPTMVHRPNDFETLIAALAEATAPDATRLVAIYGPGGFGKTTWVTQACHDARVRELFSEILWVETGEQCTPGRLVQLISDLCVHLGGTRPAFADPEQAGFHLARMLGERRALLVIDNVWSAADLAPFLLGGPACVRLVTTRNVRVCPSQTRLLRLGPMSPTEIRELLSRSVPYLGQQETVRLASLCGGWPLLATVVGSNLSQDIAAGASPSRAVSEAGEILRTHGPRAFDVSDADQRRNAIGQAITSSLRSLEENVRIGGASSLSDRYLSLAIFPAATPIPLRVLSLWWEQAHGWPPSATRQFCRVLADRSLIDTYLADQDVIFLHDVFRAYVRHLVGDNWSPLHRSLVDAYRSGNAGWDDLSPDHEYMWRNLSFHMHEAELHLELIQVLSDSAFLIKKAATFGHDSLAADHAIINAIAARFPAGQSGHKAWLVASTLASEAYLLHGLHLRSDIALTLLATFLRSANEPTVVDELRRIGAESGFEIDWATSDQDEADVSHVGAITGVAVHGSVAVTCGEDGTVRMWDLAARQHIRSYRGHTGWVFATAISGDGEIIASGGDDGMVRLWRRHTGEPIAVLVAHTRRIRSLVFAHTGSLLASGGEDGKVCLWDTERKRLLRTLDTPGVPVWSVALGCADSIAAVAGEDEFLRLYDLHTGRLLDEKVAHRDWIRSVAFATATPLLVSGSGDRTVRLWNVEGSQLTLLRAINAQPSRPRCVALSARADLILAAGEDATVRAYGSAGLVGETRADAGVDWIRTIAMTPGGGVIAGCEDGALRTWDGVSAGRLAVLGDGTITAWSAAFADSGRLALLGRSNGVIEVRESASSDLVRTLQSGTGRVWSIAAGANYVAAACGDGTVRVLALDGQRSLELNENEQRTWAVAVDRTDARVAAASSDGVVRVWDLRSGRMMWDRKAHSGRIRSIAFDATGDHLVTGGGEGTVCVWQISTDTKVCEFTNPGGWVRTVAIDAPGARVAVGSGLGDIYIRDLAEEQFIAHLPGHSGRVLMLGFASTTDQIVSAAADGTVRSWSEAEQRQSAEIRVDASLHCAAFSSDSGRLIAASAGGAVAMSTHSQ
ncbi:NB-ARC domain-containing protein [Rhizomonospora bruguierae]|uniref:NB-ARC domain-containing protein n=1 Tax=Rhizomonospora bruguierae TaxID=1581705 RepID=UPI001BCD8302|nr:NB-ARC domain-containing protein [Micromonospora sp. NBRC 107566]